MKTGKNNVHTGRLLNIYFEKNKATNTDLGRGINRTGKSILKYRRNISIQTGILIEICHATNHNFFQDIANQMPSYFTVTNDLTSPQSQLIAQLQEENKLLKMENEILMRLRG